MGIFLWLQEVFQHILNGQQPHFPCWMIRRQTHNCTLWHIVFTQPHLLAFVVHVIERGYFFPFLLPQFFSVFLESLALRLWEKFPQSKLSDRDFYAFTSALQVGSFDLSSSVLILSCNPCVFGVPQLGIQEVFHIHLDSEILIIYPPEV